MLRPETAEAMKSGRGESERWSDTVSRTMKYVAVRVDEVGLPVGVVRVAMPVRTLAERTRAARRLLRPIGLIGAAAHFPLELNAILIVAG